MVLVVDLEATCWETQPPFGETAEVIEIGLVRASPHEILRTLPPLLVRPEKSRVSPYCEKLTGRTQQDVDRGEPLGRVTKRLMRAGTRRYIWASWGAFDRRHLQEECDLKGAWFPFSDSHLNITELHALANGLGKPVGLEDALKREGLSFDGTPHRGVDDAFNAARILGRILRWPFQEKGAAEIQSSERMEEPHA